MQDNLIQTQSNTEIPADPEIISASAFTIKHSNSLFSLSGKPQTADNLQREVTDKKFFYITPYFSADYVTARFRQVYESSDDLLPDNKKEMLDFSYTAGALIELPVSKKISLQLGILYSHWFTSVSPAVVNALRDNSGDYKFNLATNYGFAEIKQSGITSPQNGDSLIVSDGFLNLQSVSLPVMVKFSMSSNQSKINVSANAGVAVNRITRDVAEVEYKAANNAEKETVQKLEGLKKTYFTAIAGIEASYPLSKVISLNVNPILRYSITPV